MRPTPPERPWYRRPVPIALTVLALLTMSATILFVVAFVSFMRAPMGNK